mgnify:CR=1 FL=1
MFLALGESIRSLSLPVKYFEALLSAFRQDVTVTRYRTWDDMMHYCQRSANPVGRLVLRIAGTTIANLNAASDAMCAALQLTNFWQDLKIDFDRGRIYLPEDERERHGALERDLAAGAITPGWQRAAGHRHARTRLAVRRGQIRLRRRPRPACATSCEPPGWAVHASSIGSNAPRFDVVRRRPRLGAADAILIAPLVLAWRPDRRAAMSRDTSFYYSFLVLPATETHRHRRGVGLLPRRGRCGGRGAGRHDGARRGCRCGATSWPPATPVARIRDAAGARAAAVHRRVQASPPPVRGPDRRRRDGPRERPLSDASRSWPTTAGASPPRSASCCVEIFGYRDPSARAYARELGMALQLTNIIRDVSADLAQRAGLPARGGSRAILVVTEDDLRAGQLTPAVRGLMRFECERARFYYTKPPPRSRRATGGACLPPRSWVRSISKSCGASSGPATTCSAAESACHG